MITAPAIPRLTFEPEHHIYRWDGQVVPSVTQILQDAGIVDYSFIPRDTREMALERGRLVHLATAMYDEGDLDSETLDPVLVPYVQAWEKFRDETGFKPIEIEKRGYNDKQRFAGTIDRIGRFRGREGRYVLDIKCGDYPAWVRWQLAAYASFDDDPRSLIRLCVGLKPTGQYDARYEFPASEWWADYQDFLCMKRVAEIRRGLR